MVPSKRTRPPPNGRGRSARRHPSGSPPRQAHASGRERTDPARATVHAARSVSPEQGRLDHRTRRRGQDIARVDVHRGARARLHLVSGRRERRRPGERRALSAARGQGLSGRAVPAFTAAHFVELEAFSRRFFEAFFARFAKPIVIVFDNYQDVPPDSRFHDLVVALLDHLSAHVRVVVLSRAEPPAALAKWSLDPNSRPSTGRRSGSSRRKPKRSPVAGGSSAWRRSRAARDEPRLGGGHGDDDARSATRRGSRAGAERAAAPAVRLFREPGLVAAPGGHPVVPVPDGIPAAHDRSRCPDADGRHARRAHPGRPACRQLLHRSQTRPRERLRVPPALPRVSDRSRRRGARTRGAGHTQARGRGAARSGADGSKRQRSS